MGGLRDGIERDRRQCLVVFFYIVVFYSARIMGGGVLGDMKCGILLVGFVEYCCLFTWKTLNKEFF